MPIDQFVKSQYIQEQAQADCSLHDTSFFAQAGSNLFFTPADKLRTLIDPDNEERYPRVSPSNYRLSANAPKRLIWVENLR
jgi:hypothetical protein